jgi:hypothetical protein
VTTNTVDAATSTESSLVHLSPTTNLNANLESRSPNSAHQPAIISAASLPATNESPVSLSSENQSVCSDSCDDTDADTVLEPKVDLLSCTEISYEKRSGTHGVAYCDSSSKVSMDASG